MNIKNKNFKMLFEYELATEIATHYSYLIGNYTFPVKLGIEKMQADINKIIVEQVDNAGCTIKLISKLNDVPFREIYLVQNNNNIDLMDFLENNEMEIDFEKFGIGFCSLVPPRKNGIDLYL